MSQASKRNELTRQAPAPKTVVDLAADWVIANPILAAGQFGYIEDQPGVYKLGDGVTAWNDLAEQGGGGSTVLLADFEYRDGAAGYGGAGSDWKRPCAAAGLTWPTIPLAAEIPEVNIVTNFVHPDLVSDGDNTGGVKADDWMTRFGPGVITAELQTFIWLENPESHYILFSLDAANSDYSSYVWGQRRSEWLVGQAGTNVVNHFMSAEARISDDYWSSDDLGFAFYAPSSADSIRSIANPLTAVPGEFAIGLLKVTVQYQQTER